MRNCNCRAEYIAKWKRENRNKLATLNEDKLIMPCEVVVHSHDAHGAPRTTFYDCKNKKFVAISQSEYLTMLNRGEL